MINTARGQSVLFVALLAGGSLRMDWGEPGLAKKSAHVSTAHPVADAGRQAGGRPHRSRLSRTLHLGNAAVEHEVLQLFADQVPHYLQQLRDASVARPGRRRPTPSRAPPLPSAHGGSRASPRWPSRVDIECRRGPLRGAPGRGGGCRGHGGRGSVPVHRSAAGQSLSQPRSPAGLNLRRRPANTPPPQRAASTGARGRHARPAIASAQLQGNLPRPWPRSRSSSRTAPSRSWMPRTA